MYVYVVFEIVLNTTKWWLVTNLKSRSEANSEWQECAQKSMYIHISMNEKTTIDRYLHGKK